MNELKKAKPKWRWLKTLLVIALTLMPIWYAPIRTAPVQSHLTAWALMVIAALLYCVQCPDSANNRIGGVLRCWIGGAIGGIGSAALYWDMIPNLDDEGKLVAFYFIGAIGVWFFLAQPTGEGSVK